MDREERHKKLEDIRGLAMEGRYEVALGEIQRLRQSDPNDLEFLRVQGNVLELKALDLAQYDSKSLLQSVDYVSARSCYEQIVAADAGHTLALIDLGTHFANLDAYTKAANYYEGALELLRLGEFRVSLKDETEELFDAYIELCKEAGLDAKREELERERDTFLGRPLER